MRSVFLVRLVLVAVLTILSVAALVISAVGIASTLSDPLVIKTSFQRVTLRPDVEIPTFSVCGTTLVGVDEELSQLYGRNGPLWRTGNSLIHSVLLTSATLETNKLSSQLVRTENVQLRSVEQFVDSTFNGSSLPDTFPPGTVVRSIDYDANHRQAEERLRLETYVQKREWERAPVLPGSPRRCFDFHRSLLPNTAVGSGRRQVTLSLLEFPTRCNVTELEAKCVANGTNVLECYPMYCWEQWTFSLVDAFVVVGGKVQISLQANKFAQILLQEQRVRTFDGIEEITYIPTVSYEEYKFGRYGAFHALYVPTGYDPNTTTREEYFESLTRPLPGSNFFGVSLAWTSNVVTVLTEESSVDPRFLVGSFVGILAIVVGMIFSLFMTWVAWIDGENAHGAKSKELEDDFESSKVKL